VNTAWADLLNSDWRDYRGSGRTEDRLDNENWLRKFLSRWEGTDGLEADTAFRDELRRLRKTLNSAVDATINGRPIPQELLESLNSIMAAAPVVLRLKQSGDRYGIEHRSAARTRDSVLSIIALSFAEVLVHGEPNRIKTCENSDCGWVFYDLSKNQTRRWCDTGCGNLMKIRRFRARNKTASQ
jgi:predicted RNA-binding Zn ribbon-like protein